MQQRCSTVGNAAVTTAAFALSEQATLSMSSVVPVRGVRAASDSGAGPVCWQVQVQGKCDPPRQMRPSTTQLCPVQGNCKMIDWVPVVLMIGVGVCVVLWGYYGGGIVDLWGCPSVHWVVGRDCFAPPPPLSVLIVARAVPADCRAGADGSGHS